MLGLGRRANSPSAATNKKGGAAKQGGAKIFADRVEEMAAEEVRRWHAQSTHSRRLRTSRNRRRRRRNREFDSTLGYPAPRRHWRQERAHAAAQHATLGSVSANV